MTMTALSPQQRTKIYGLDAVRLLAAMLVVAYHLGFKAWAVSGSTLNLLLGTVDAHPSGWQLTWFGWVGVQVFFVVSGAVIAYSAQGTSPGNFAKNRLARLLPALMIAVLIAVPVAVVMFAVPAGKVAWLALKTLAFSPWGPWIMGQFWTIPIELCFYGLVWGLLAWTGPGEKWGLSQGAGMRALAWALGGASAGYWIAVSAGLLSAGGRLAELLLLQHGMYFAIGLLCARLGTGNLGVRHLALALVCILAAAMQVCEAAAWEMTGMAEMAERWWQAYLVWLAITACIALSFLHRDAIAARCERFHFGLRLAGMLTYPLYLTHIHVGGAVLLACAPWGPLPAFLAASCGSLFVSLIIAYLFEPPLYLAVKWAINRMGRLAPTLAPGV